VPRLPASARTPLIGREPVLDSLWNEVTASAQHGGRVAVVRGPAGIGKTRLLEEYASRARSLGAVVVAGRSSAVGGYPYGALADALAAYVRSSAPAAATIRRAGPPLAALVPALVSPDEFGEALAEPSMLAVVQAAYRLVAGVTERRPMVFILDDVHAADAETCEVLHSLCRHAHDQPWTLVLGLRQPGEERSAPGRRLVEVLRRSGDCLDIELSPLDEPGTAALATAVLGEGLPAVSLVEVLHRRTAGNPYYVEEMVRWFRSAGHLRREGLQWTLQADSDGGVPPSIEEALSERISTLPAADRAVLEWICAAGGRASLSLLGDVSGLDAPSLGASLEQLSHSQLVTEEGGRSPEYRVRHPLVSDCVYREMSLARRRVAHRALAFALSDRGAPAAVVATHFSRCADLGDADAISAAMQAAADAESALHLARAVSWYQLALSLLPPSESARRPVVLERLSELASQVGLFDVGLAATQELLAHTPDDAVARRLVVLRRLAELRGLGGHVESIRAVIDEALALAEHGDASVARLLVEMAMYVCTSLPVADVIDVVSRAEAVATRFGAAGRPTVLMLISIRAHAMAYGGDPAVAASMALDAGTEALALEDGMALGCSVFSRAVANVMLGRFGEAADALGVLGDATEQAGLSWEATSTWAMRTEALANLGKFDDAVADSLRAEDFGRRNGSHNMLELAIIMGAQALILRGDVAAGRERLAEARRLLDRRQTSFESAYWAGCALAAEACEDVAGAVDAYARMWEWATLHGCLWMVAQRSGQVHALLSAGDVAGALSVAREICAFLAEHDIPRARPAASVALGAALIASGSVVDGVTEVQCGLDACAAVDGPLIPALTRLRAGEALLVAGERRRAVELLGEAHAAFADMGARWLRDRTRAALRGAGVAVGLAAATRQMRDGSAASNGASGDPMALLSRRECDVATLAASGSSSRSIGLRLGISERTVENHLANAYAKLRVHSRAELIALLSGGTPVAG
jgi:DNA-binding CsgD family transcriptional regulator/tetratricopeptide (TPR) repeat protein